MNDEARKEEKAVVFVIRHSDALIVGAAHGKNKQGGRMLLIELYFKDVDGRPQRVRDVFSDNEEDQKRLKLLCRVLSVNPKKPSLKDLVGKQVLLVRIMRKSEGGKRLVWAYSPARASAGKLNSLKNRLFERAYNK